MDINANIYQQTHEAHGLFALADVGVDVDFGEELHEALADEGQDVGGVGGAEARDGGGAELADLGALVAHAHEEDVEVLGQGDEHGELGVGGERVEDVVADVGLVVGDGADEEFAEGARDDRGE